MTTPAAVLDRLHERAFASTDPHVEVIIRSLIGWLILWWSAAWLVDASALLSDNSIYPTEPSRRFSWSVFAPGAPTWWVVAVLLAVVVAGVGLAAGRASRIATVVAFIGVVSIQRLQPAAINAGDQLLRLLLVWMIVSLVLGSRSTLTGSVTTPGAVRPRILITAVRFQIVLVYTTSVLWKLQGEAWRSGEAVYAALHNPSVASFPLPEVLSETTLGVGVLTYAVLAIEAMLPFLLLRARLKGIALAYALHIGFAIFLRVGIFTPTMLVAVLAFLEPDDLRRLERRWRQT